MARLLYKGNWVYFPKEGCDERGRGAEKEGMMCEWGVTGDCLESRQRCAEEWRTFWFKGIPECL